MSRQIETRSGLPVETLMFGESYLIQLRSYLPTCRDDVLSPVDPITMTLMEEGDEYWDDPETLNFEEIGIMRSALYMELGVNAGKVVERYSYDAPENAAVRGTIHVKELEISRPDFPGWTLQEHIDETGKAEFLVGVRGMRLENIDNDEWRLSGEPLRPV